MPATDDYLRKPKTMHQVFCAQCNTAARRHLLDDVGGLQ